MPTRIPRSCSVSLDYRDLIAHRTSDGLHDSAGHLGADLELMHAELIVADG